MSETQGSQAIAEAAEQLVRLDPLPDSRLRVIHTTKNAVWRGTAWWVPIFCFSCGREGGLVPEENMTFAGWLCDPCYEKYGQIDGLYTEPDRIFWERVKLEQIEKYGRVLTPGDLLAVVEADASPLATLVKQGR